MFCPNCGHELDDDAVFCTNCGAKIDDVGTEPESGYTAPEPSFQTPENQNRQEFQGKPKKKKTGMIVLIIIIAFLTTAIIAGIVVFILIQRDRNQQITAFRDVVQSFEEELDQANYTSIQDEISDLMSDCQQAINDRAVESIDELEQRIDDLRSRLETLTDQISSLEELRDTYKTMVEEQYYVPDELAQNVQDIFDSLQQAIDDGAGDQLENMRAQMDEMIAGLESENINLINSIKSAVDEMDLSGASDEEKSSLDNFVNEIQQLIDSKNFQQAIECAQSYVDYAQQVEQAILAREEEKRQESEAESRRESEEAAAEAAKNDYICPGSDSRYLTEADVSGLSDWELLLARNEIYARHGRKFDDPSIRAYFESKSWYNGTIDPDNFDASVFNDYEKANIEFIQQHEK